MAAFMCSLVTSIHAQTAPEEEENPQIEVDSLGWNADDTNRC